MDTSQWARRFVRTSPERGKLTSILPAGITREEALAIQLASLRLQVESGEELGAWKVGMTSGPFRDGLGNGFRPFGYVLRSRIYSSGSVLPLGDLVRPGVEPELAFRVSEQLGAGCTEAQVLRAIDCVAPSFEILENRFRVAAIPDLLADGVNNWGIVVGAPCRWHGRAADVSLSLSRDETVVADVGPNYSIDEPVRSIRALASLLGEYGECLEPGQWCITGAFAKFDIDRASSWRASFGTFGEVAVRFS